ncbi:hypothetical protein C8J27_101606 [Rhodobacter aestuarii]|uniref:Uncharacterized protein n=1 Tax=Rhodobacter aestuarii TaxID=453582 RepID=A0A1N7IVE0_9RHOB|nr:hypothetical protein [Rhodobacter aestuarii]PTV97490.1 hypothetical protein C8J27_101606 [Rhodobacter aestuarii]SIS41048.1 hypothetical protein SAMN05421580_10136 [Rhodobacter aestuarii]
MKHPLFTALMLGALMAAPALAESFSNFPAAPYQGTSKMPDFNGAQKDYTMFRTRLGNAAQREADFAGSWVVEQFGCGTGCSLAFVVDHKTGQILDLPVGGENNLYLRLYHRADSRLMKTTWIDGFWDSGKCMIGEWSLENGAFQPVAVTEHFPLEDCQN